jgi:hypothetical protein
MNFWTDWLKSIGENLGEVVTGGAVSFGAGQAAKQAALLTPQAPKQEPGQPPVTDIGTALFKQSKAQAQQAISMATPYRQYVAPRITTQILKTSQNSPYYGNKEAAQEAAKYISPGQATLLGGANILPGIQDIEKIDWRNADDVAGFFESNRAASIGSGIFDFSYNIAGDPFILAGGGYSALRRSVIINPIKGPVQAQRVADQFQRAAQGEVNPATPFIDKVMKAESRADLAWGASEQSSSTMNVLDALFEAKSIAGRQGVADVYSVAFGHKPSYDRLAGRSAILKQRLQDEIEVDAWITQELNTPLGQSINAPFWSTAEYDSYFANKSLVVDELKKEFDWLDGVLKGEVKPQEILDSFGKNIAPDATGLFGVMANRSIPKWKWASSLQAEADLARAKNYLDQTVFESPNGTRMRMVSWLSQGGMIGELPPGWLKVGAATSQQSHKDVMSLIQRASKDLDIQKDGNWKRQQFDSYLMAKNKAERNAWVKNFDRQFTEQAVIKTLNIDPTNTKKVNAARIFAEYLEAQHTKAKAGALSRFIKNKYVTVDNEGLPTIAPQLAKALENTNLSKADLEGTALFESQIADVVPMMDTRMMRRIIEENKETIKLIIDSDIEQYVSGNKLESTLKEFSQLKVAKGVTARTNETLDVIENTMDKIYSFWKPITLLRLGYTQRNIFEGAARVVAVSTMLPYLYGSNTFSFLKDTASSSARGVALGPKNYVKGRVSWAYGKQYQRLTPESTVAIKKIEGQINLGMNTVARLERDARQLSKLLNTQARAKVRDIRTIIKSRLDPSNKDLDDFEKALFDFADSTPGAKDYISIGEILSQRVLNARNQQSVLNTFDGIVEDVSKFSNSIEQFVQLRGQGVTSAQVSSDIRSLTAKLNKVKASLKEKNLPDNTEVRDLQKLISKAKRDKDLLDPKLMSNVFVKSGVKLSAVELEALKKMGQVYNELAQSWSAIRDSQKERLGIINKMGKISNKATFEKEYSARPFMVEGQMVPSAADGVLGDVMYKMEASGAQTARNYFNSDSIQNSYMSSTMRTASWQKIDPSDLEWYDSMVYYTNEQIRKDSVALKILLGKNDAEILNWFRTNDGKRYLTVNKNAVQSFGGGSSSQFLNWIRATVEKTVPQFSDEGVNLRTKLANGTFTKEDIMKFPEKLRSSVPGIELVPGKHTLNQRWSETVNWLFKYLGSLPEDTLLRHPFYETVYKMEMRRLAKLWTSEGKDFGPNDYAMFGNQAHARALKTLNETLFTIQRYSNPAQFLKFASPFYSAGQNSSRFWLGRTFENPAIPAVGLQIWNAPNQAFEVYDANDNLRKVDSSYPFTGANEQVWITVPQKVAKSLGIGDNNIWKISKNSVLSTIVNADNPILPSMAWPVTFPASILFKKLAGSAFDPDKLLESVGFPGKMIRSTLTGGQISSKGLVESVLPQNPIEVRFKRLIQTINGNPDQTASNRIAALNKKKQAELAFEGRPMTSVVLAELAKESTEEVINSLVIETFLAGAFPAATSIGTDWELMQSEYNRYVKADPVLGSASFAKDYGNVISSIASGSLSRNVYGIKSNNATLGNIKKWSSFIEKVEGYTDDDDSLIGSLVNTDPSSFSSVAYQALGDIKILGKPLRTKATPSEQIQKDDINLGWSYYIPFAQEIDDLARLGQINSDQASFAKKEYSKVIASLHPFWAFQKRNFDSEGDQSAVNFVYAVLENKDFVKDATGGNDYRADLWTALSEEWAPFRLGISDILQERKAAGGSADINAKSNAEIRASVDQFYQLLTDQYSAFGEFYQRHLYNDKFIPVTANLTGVNK